MDVKIDNVSNVPNNYDYINNIGTNPWSLMFLSVVILVYYLIFASLGGGSSSGSDTSGQPAIKSFIFLEFCDLSFITFGDASNLIILSLPHTGQFIRPEDICFSKASIF